MDKHGRREVDEFDLCSFARPTSRKPRDVGHPSRNNAQAILLFQIWATRPTRTQGRRIPWAMSTLEIPLVSI